MKMRLLRSDTAKFPIRSELAMILVGAVIVVIVMGGCTSLLQKNPPLDKSPFNSADIEVIFNEEKVPREHITISRNKLIVTGLTNAYDNLQAKGKITISERSTAFNAFPLSIGFDDPTGIASKSQSLLEAFMLVPAEGREQEMDILIDFSGVAVKELISADLFSATYGPSESALVISPTTPPQAGMIEVDNAGNKIIINGFTNLSDGAAGLFKVIELPAGYTSSELVIDDPPSIDAITTNIGKIIIAEGTDTGNPVNGNSETYEVVARFFDTSALGNKDITVVYNGKESDPGDIDVANGVVTITNLTNAYTHLNAEVSITIEDDLRPFSVMPRTVTISDPAGITNISVTNRGQFTIVPADGNAFLMDVVTHFKGIPVAELITAASFEGSFNTNNPLPSRIFQTSANAFAVKFTNVMDGVAGTFSFKDQATPEPPTPPDQYLPAGYVYEVNEAMPPSPATLPIAITDPDGAGIVEFPNHGLYTITVAEGSIAAPTEGNSETYTMHIHFKPLIEILDVGGTIVAFNTPTPHIGTLDENYVAYFPLSLTNASCREYAPEVMIKVGGSATHNYNIGEPAPAINHYFDEVVAANNVKTDAQELRITETDGDVTIYTLTPTIQECLFADPIAAGRPATILGAGTSGNPWQIDNDMKLDLIARTTSPDSGGPSSYRDEHYMVTEAIDLGIVEAPWSQGSAHANPRAHGFTPIGSTPTATDMLLDGRPNFESNAHTNNFKGKFNCDNHEIANLYINNTVISGVTNGNLKGLFAYISGSSEINNCKLRGPSVTGSMGVGALVGLMGGSSKVLNSAALLNEADGTVTATRFIVGGLVGSAAIGTEISDSHATIAVSVGIRATGAAGGLVGELGGGTVTASYASGAIAGRDYSGGLIGLGSGGMVTNSYATGVVSGIGDVGGLVGAVAHGGPMTITESYATGNVSGDNNVGGLAGSLPNAEAMISTSYATGTVTGRSNIGGFAGRNNGNIKNSYATGTVTGVTNVGGFVGYNTLSISNSYATGAVSGTASVGGFNGLSDSGAVITTSYWDTDTSGLTASDGGTGRTTVQLQVANPVPSGSAPVYVGWDTTMIWQLQSGAYPQFR